MRIVILCYTDGRHQDGMRIAYCLQHKYNHNILTLSLTCDPKSIVEAIKGFKPDFCLVTIGREFSAEALKEIKKYTFLVHWSLDEHTPAEDIMWEKFKNIYDLAFVKSKGLIPLLKDYCKKVIWTPMFYDTYFDGIIEVKPEKQYQLIFTGNPHITQSTLRQLYLKQLSEDGYPVLVVGHYWEDKDKAFGNTYPGGLIGKELIGFIAASKIGLNFENDLMAKIELGFSDRVIKTMSAGTLCLTHEIPGIEQLFIPEKHLVTYKNYVDLLEKITYYISHDDEREQIAKAGQELVLREYNIDKVVGIYLEEIRKCLENTKRHIA